MKQPPGVKRMTCNGKTIINGSTRIAGVIGWPIEHTLSPAMQNAAFGHYRLEAVYLPLGVAPPGLRVLLMTLKHLNAWGVNVTIPYKEKVMAYVDDCAASAKQIGAVNTIIFKKDRLTGHNTDGYGFLESLKGTIHPQGKSAVLIGGGGAGRAVAVSLALAKVKQLTIVEVDQKRLGKLLRHIKQLGYASVKGIKPDTSALRAEVKQAALLVNATPLGLKTNDPLPLPQAWMPEKVCVMDLVYGKRPTPFLQLAKKNKNLVIPGWKMLLYQGAEAFRLWTGKKPPVACMQQALMVAGGLKVI